LEIDGIAKSYRDVEALHHVTLTPESGITGLLGPNGAGKSTLGSACPTSGSCLVSVSSFSWK